MTSTYFSPLLPKSQWPKLYWGDNYPRLLQIKEKYDCGHVFRNPQSVGADQIKPIPEFEIKTESPEPVFMFSEQIKVEMEKVGDCSLRSFDSVNTC